MTDISIFFEQSIINHRLNLLYLLAAICIIYKLTWISRQASLDRSLAALAFRTTAAIVGTIILWKALERFDGADPAKWIDIFRELSWCAFLFSAICLLRAKLGHW